MRKRTWISLAIVTAVVAALLATVYLRKNAPPEVTRLLPEADAIVFLNLKPLRTLTAFSQHPVAHAADYQAFIDATGIEFERDLDQAAFAIHRMADPNGPNGPVAYSEIFHGRFSSPRLTAYLAAQKGDVEHYAGHDIYSMPHEGRTVRIAVLGYDLVAVSNTPTAEQIHSMIDRYHSDASPFSGDTLLSQHYSDVPLLSESWGIGQIGLPFATGRQFQVFGLPLPLPINSTFIASVRYVGALHFRLEQIAPTATAARQSVEIAKFALGLLRSSQITTDPQDEAAQDWNTLLNSTTVEQKGNRAILRAVVPTHLLHELTSPAETSSDKPGVTNAPGSNSAPQ
ncbi:MAG: hypothetical protein H0U76_07880 [Ktedonobacteraceae bacterium]|nr:hypothetical protein [Ktedonobacteraceae bacterium]